jgi:hypothetical protein
MIRKSRDYGVMNIDGGIRAEFNKLVDVKPFHNNNEINIERAIIKKTVI